MCFNRFSLVSLALAASFSARAATLQFTNVTALAGSSSKLYGVAYDGLSKFVAVGEQEAFVRSSFSSNQSLLLSGNWNAGTTSGNAQRTNLLAVTFGSGMFVTTGFSNRVFSSEDGLS